MILNAQLRLRDRFLFALLFGTGMRIGQALGLRHEDFVGAAAARKRSDAITRTQAALREIRQDGESITFQSVARRAGVSRQWLYEQPDLRNEIERLRAAAANQPARAAVAGRASDASLKQRLKTLSEENQRLRGENRALRQELAIAYGKRRDAQVSS